MTNRALTKPKKSNAPTVNIDLVVDWATHEAADFACKNFHYSHSIPRSKLVKIGAWENGKFIGVVIFSYGATPKIGKPYDLSQQQVCELTRIALTRHASPVTQIMSRALKMLRTENPGLRLVVSYADPDQGHVGRIYQAGNWIYEGQAKTYCYDILGKREHPKTLYDRYGTHSVPWLQANVDPNAQRIILPSKHKYLMALDKRMKRQIGPGQAYPQPVE